MAVNVQQFELSDRSSTRDVYIEQGHHFEVTEGVLEVLDALDGRRIALFAAGTWLSAQVED